MIETRPSVKPLQSLSQEIFAIHCNLCNQESRLREGILFAKDAQPKESRTDICMQAASFPV